MFNFSSNNSHNSLIVLNNGSATTASSNLTVVTTASSDTTAACDNPQSSPVTVPISNSNSTVDTSPVPPKTSCCLTWLSEDISDHEFSPSDYQLQRLDRNKHGGGILIYVHNSLSFKVLLQGGPHSLEFLALSISTNSNNSNTVCICLFYRPPSSPVSIFDNLCTTLQLVQPPKFLFYFVRWF